jgi:N-acetylglucosaminyldiphosphoundecaprenol N-acetyl-beta-D-mannosaminyltransferase
MITKNAQTDNISSITANKDKSYKKSNSLVKTFILGIGITNDKNEKILEYIVNFIKKTTKNCYIVTPNPEMIVLSTKDNSFKSIINSAELALCDGVGVAIAGNILKKPLMGRFTGVDFVEKLCDKASDQQISVGFLGGRHGVAEKAAECLQRKYPDLIVSLIEEEWKENKAKIDILFVAFGAPKQEKWMSEHINKIPVRVMVGVGGALDYISGNVIRAPKVMQYIGLEWLFRLIIQPWRIKRQFALIEFIFLIIKEKLFNKIH